MNRLVRWGTTLGLLGSTIAGSMLATGLPAWALTEAELLQKLGTVPMFTVTDANGSPLVANISNEENNTNIAVAGVFVSPADAQAFIERVQQQGATGEVQVTPVSLAEVYTLQQRSEESDAGLVFQYLPSAEEVNSAVSILQAAGEEITAEQFNGVPVFLARSSVDGGYLTVSRDNETVIPAFFDAEALQSLISRAESQNSELQGTIMVQVVNLEGIIATLEDSDNADLSQLEFIPSADSITYIRSLSPSGGGAR